ncbi:MAG: RNB domain-containing ribonuclease [Pirellulales bacterium]
MLAANEAVARLLADKDIPFLRRVHPDPDPRRLKLLTEFVKDLGIETESLESRFELQRVLNEVADQPERHAVNYAVLRACRRRFTLRRTKGITRWPASAIATSRRRFALPGLNRTSPDRSVGLRATADQRFRQTDDRRRALLGTRTAAPSRPSANSRSSSCSIT